MGTGVISGADYHKEGILGPGSCHRKEGIRIKEEMAGGSSCKVMGQ